MPYNISFTKDVVTLHIPALPTANAEQIKKAIEQRLTVDPVGLGKPLRNNLKGYFRLRVGDYRVVYRVQGNTVIISVIKHRKDVYDQ